MVTAATNIMPVDGPRMPVSGSTCSRPLDAARRSYDHSAWRFGSLMNTLLRSESTTTLCSVGYGSLTTRIGATSPPAIVALSQPGGQEAGSASWSRSRQPFSSSSACSRASNVGAPGTGQIVPSGGVSPGMPPLNEKSSSPAVAMTSLRIRLLSEQNLRPELNLTRRRDGPCDAARRRQRRLVGRRRGEHDPIGRREVRSVEQVEQFEPQLQVVSAAER